MPLAGSQPMDNWNAGEIGGVFAGFVAALAALGKGVAWLLGRDDRRAELRDKKLQAWEDSLARREVEQRAQTETRLVVLERQVRRLQSRLGRVSGSLLEVTVELREVAPLNPALLRAEALLKSEFEADPDTPEDMLAAARKLDGGRHGNAAD